MDSNTCISRTESLVATFTGRNRRSAANDIISAVASAGALLIDIRQSVVQNRITLVVELELDDGKHNHSSMYRSLLKVAKSLDLSIDFDIPDIEQTMQTMQLDAQTTPGLDVQSISHEPYTYHVLTLLARTDIHPHFLSQLASMLADHQFITGNVRRLSASTFQCLEMVVGTAQTLSPTYMADVRKQLYALGIANGIDVALQAESVLRRSKRLVVFDMDSTLIQQEVIDEIARHAGVYDQVCEITNRAMGGSLDFNQSLEQRVALLKGTPSSVFDKVIANLVYTPGAKELCRTLKRLGYRLAVISGGFTRVTEHVRNELGLDYDYANQLEEVNGVFTGRTIGAIVNARRKADLLITIAQLEQITLDQVIAIGDGANDLPMLGTAGLGVAFNAKPAVQEAASFRLNQPSLTAVLYLLGLSQEEQEEVVGKGSSSSKRME